MKTNERSQALHILTRVFEDKISLSHAQASQELTPLSQELCFGVCRYYYRLNALARHLVHKPPKEFEVWIVLVLGLYQLQHLRMPDYAVVKETVQLLERIQKSWAKGFVNAILRRYCREKEQLLSALKDDLEFQYNHPSWFIQRIQHDWPQNWSSILKANDERAPMSLRVNPLKNTPENYINTLQTAGLRGHLHPYAAHGVALEHPRNVNELPGFQEGDVSVQDMAAQLSAPLLQLKPNLRVLDACCAPGGKLCHILETEPSLNTCLGLDSEPQRLTRVKENLHRLNLNAELKTGDARAPQSWWDGVAFDRILLDAPCSATGVIRRHPDIKVLRTPEDAKQARQLQRELLEALWPLLTEEGLLIYATCSIMPEENEHQIARFAEHTDDCECVLTPQPWGHSTGHGWQILPGESGMDGFFYSVLRKTVKR